MSFSSMPPCADTPNPLNASLRDKYPKLADAHAASWAMRTGLDRVRRYPTPPPKYKEDFVQSGNVRLRERRAKEIEEAADFLGITYEESADMNSKYLEKYYEIRQLILESRASLNYYMERVDTSGANKEGTTSVQMIAAVTKEKKSRILRDTDPVLEAAERLIPWLIVDETKWEARGKIRACIAHPDTTAAELRQVFSTWRKGGGLDDRDEACSEAKVAIAKLQAQEGIQACLTKMATGPKVSEGGPGYLRQVDDLIQVLASERMFGKLADDNDFVLKAEATVTDLRVRVVQAREKIQESLEEDLSSPELAEILEEAQYDGQLENDDAEVVSLAARITEVKEKEDRMAILARINIREGMEKLKSSVQLARLLAKEQHAGRLSDDDPLIVELIARIAVAKQEEGGSDSEEEDSDEAESSVGGSRLPSKASRAPSKANRQPSKAAG